MSYTHFYIIIIFLDKICIHVAQHLTLFRQKSIVRHSSAFFSNLWHFYSHNSQLKDDILVEPCFSEDAGYTAFLSKPEP
jgi:hypothetical protein